MAVRVLPTASAARIAWMLPVALLAIAVLWTISAIVPLGAAARFLSFTLLCAVPGVVLVRRLYRAATQSWLFALLLGPAWGYALTSLTLLALWLTGVRRPIWFVLGAVATAVVCGLMPALPSTVRVPALGRRDLRAVCLTLLLVPAIVGLPYRRVGQRLPEGEAWRAYFTADFVWAMAVRSEVSKGDVLPKNTHRIGTALHYYWLAHLVPSIEYRAMSGHASLRQLLLANAVLAGLASSASSICSCAISSTVRPPRRWRASRSSPSTATKACNSSSRCGAWARRCRSCNSSTSTRSTSAGARDACCSSASRRSSAMRCRKVGAAADARA